MLPLPLFQPCSRYPLYKFSEEVEMGHQVMAGGWDLNPLQRGDITRDPLFFLLRLRTHASMVVFAFI